MVGFTQMLTYRACEQLIELQGDGMPKCGIVIVHSPINEVSWPCNLLATRIN